MCSTSVRPKCNTVPLQSSLARHFCWNAFTTSCGEQQYINRVKEVRFLWPQLRETISAVLVNPRNTCRNRMTRSQPSEEALQSCSNIYGIGLSISLAVLKLIPRLKVDISPLWVTVAEWEFCFRLL